jgi:hypothetical protein
MILDELVYMVRINRKEMFPDLQQEMFSIHPARKKQPYAIAS